jgi:hypothetical protein
MIGDEATGEIRDSMGRVDELCVSLSNEPLGEGG